MTTLAGMQLRGKSRLTGFATMAGLRIFDAEDVLAAIPAIEAEAAALPTDSMIVTPDALARALREVLTYEVDDDEWMAASDAAAILAALAAEGGPA